MSPAKLIKRLFVTKQLGTYRIDAQLINQVFMKELSSLWMLLCQGLSIRGHTEQEGNLMQLLYLRSDDDPRLKEWIKDSKYLSVDIVNECVMLDGWMKNSRYVTIL